MRNFVQPGQYGLTIIAPAAVTSGSLVIVGAIVGVAAYDAAAGAQVEISPEGVFDLAKVPADSLATGAVAKIVTASGLVGAAGTSPIGWVVAAAGAGSTVVRVRLTPTVGGAPTTLMEAEASHSGHPLADHGQHPGKKGKE